MDQRNKTIAFVIFIVLIATGLVWGIVYAIRYEKELDVLIEDRWWTYEQRVRYKTWDCDVSVDMDGNVSTSCGYDYYTRCRMSKTGREWAPQSPELVCIMKQDDWIESSVFYTVLYRVPDTVDTGKISISSYQWDTFAPGGRGHITLGAFNSLKSFERDSYG